MRPRVCAAIIRDGHILMARHEGDGDNFWTLPGGGIEAGESHQQAVMREVLEETCLHVSVGQFLFEEAYSAGRTYCYLAQAGDAEDAKLGLDPEEGNTPRAMRRLKEVAWHPLGHMKNDIQVSKVIAILNLNI